MCTFTARESFENQGKYEATPLLILILRVGEGDEGQSKGTKTTGGKEHYGEE